VDASPSDSSSRTLIPPQFRCARTPKAIIGAQIGRCIGLGSCFIRAVAAAEFRAGMAAADFAAAGLSAAVEPAECRVVAVPVLRAALLAAQAFLREVEL